MIFSNQKCLSELQKKNIYISEGLPDVIQYYQQPEIYNKNTL